MAKIGTRKRGASWQYYFEGNKVDGKRKQIVKSGFKTKKEAYVAGMEAWQRHQEAEPFEASNISVDDFLDEWVRLYVEPNLTPRTQQGYISILNVLVRPKFGSMKLRDLTPTMLQELVNEMHKTGLSKSYISALRVVMKGALDYAIKPLGLIKTNPMRDVRAPRGSKKPKERRAVSKEELAIILERFEGTAFHLPIMIGYHTGLRISECYGLTWDDVDLKNDVLEVSKQLVRVGSKWKFTEPKTTSSYRKVKFGKTLHDAFVAERRKQERDRKACGEYYKDTMNLVNAKQGGGFYNSLSFAYAARVIHHELGIKEFSYHTLRHTHATMLIEAGANIKGVSARLGHSDITTTLQIYAHATEKMDDEAVGIFETISEL